MSWTLDDKFRIHAWLSNTSYMHLYSRTSVSLRRLYIGQFLSLHFKDRDEVSSAKDQRIYYMITKYFHAPWNYQMNLLVSLWFLFCFVLFSFRTNLWPHLLTKNIRKAFIHMTRINCLVTTLFEVFNRLEAFLFYPFLGNQRGTQKKTHFALFGNRSEHRFSCSLVGPTTT